jgi:hypothetical protein
MERQMLHASWLQQAQEGGGWQGIEAEALETQRQGRCVLQEASSRSHVPQVVAGGVVACVRCPEY